MLNDKEPAPFVESNVLTLSRYLYAFSVASLFSLQLWHSHLPLLLLLEVLCKSLEKPFDYMLNA